MPYGEIMSDELNSAQAATELSQADAVARRVRDQSHWMTIFFAVFAVCFAAVTLIVGLVAPLPGMLAPVVVSTVVFVALLVAGMVVWAWTRPAMPRGRGRGVWAWAITAALYPAALNIGTSTHQTRPVYWIPAALIVAIPLTIAAWREHRG